MEYLKTEQKKSVDELRKQGMKSASIAKRLGLTHELVQRHLGIRK